MAHLHAGIDRGLQRAWEAKLSGLGLKMMRRDPAEVSFEEMAIEPEHAALLNLVSRFSYLSEHAQEYIIRTIAYYREYGASFEIICRKVEELIIEAEEVVAKAEEFEYRDLIRRTGIN